jgi:hypothetical protein
MLACGKTEKKAKDEKMDTCAEFTLEFLLKLIY